MKGMALILVVAACGPDHGVTSDPFPIGVDLSDGALLAEIVEGDDPTQLAVIDLMAPITVIDANEDRVASRRFADLTLLGRTAVGDLVPRAHLELTVTEFHPCPSGEPCRIGTSGQIFDVVIGADAFDTGAIRVDLFHEEVRLFPDIAGEGSARGRLCEAVFSRPFAGGGEVLIAHTLVTFPPRRIAMGACLHHDLGFEGDGGADALLVVSTAVGPTILSESAYERWRAAAGGTMPADTLAQRMVHLPSGPLVGGAATIDRLALVGSDNEVRGPCRQVYAHHLLSARNCDRDDDCPCSDGTFCRVPAIVELTPEAIDVLVVPDDDPTLQALRLELRPGSPEVDGILGTQALTATSIDVDTPNDRVLVRCEDANGCRARPELLTENLRELIADCDSRADATDLDAGVPDAAL